MSRVLPLLGEQHLAQVVQSRLLQYDGRTDLTAVVSDDNAVSVYRLGGQRNIHIEVEDLSGKPACLSWARNGELLLVGTDSGCVDALYTRTGKIIAGREHGVGSGERNSITGIGTLVHNFDGGTHDGHPEQAGFDAKQDDDEFSVEKWFDQINISNDAPKPAQNSSRSLGNLPYALAKVDPANNLPRLSAIPPPSRAGPGMPIPTLRNAQKDIHLLLSGKPSHAPRGIEVSFISLSSGSMESNIGELFRHTFKRPPSTDDEEIIVHKAQSKYGTHAVLRGQVSSAAEGATLSIAAISIDLYQVPFANNDSVHTETILSSATQLKLLEQYVKQTIDTAVLDWSTLTTLPGRFISSINETLEEKQEGRIDQHFYQLLLTGYCSPAVIEWLRDDLGDRGHKRWDHAMTTFYHAVSHLMEVNLLPVLECCALTASTLRGLATFYEGSKKFDVPPSFFSRIIESIGCIQLLAHEILQIAGQEERHFRAFSSWLRNQIDIATAEPGSTAAIELAEREAMSTDVPKILSYLEGAFTGSRLAAFLGRRLQPAEITTRLGVLSVASESTADAIRTARDTKDSADDLLYLPVHLANLHSHIEACSEQMKRWQSTTWQPPDKIRVDLEHEVASVDFDVRALNRDETVITIAMIDAVDGRQVMLHRVTVKYPARSSLSSVISQEKSTLEVEGIERLSCVKLLGDSSLLVLMQQQGRHSMARIPITCFAAGRSSALSPQQLDDLVIHEFEARDFTPEHLYISDNAERRNVLVLNDTCQRWKIFRLPSEAMTRGVSSRYHAEGEERSPFALNAEDDMALEQ
ncbi:Anaphase-promoting complex subunit 4 [Sphaceloma murrayae]|uniref:Anaphase-promoting complex subunit 4 n=1 Tax=Sphaceloma murrayae TaxID=2082308 RepID=A0A2K1QJ80_9PEZI|nr:Anaphase-promoting complex subunit 4 [Sphaceloma murrayae]